MPFDGGKIKKDFGQINLAPIEPLSKLKDKGSKSYEYSSFHQFIRELSKETRDKNIEMRREMAEIGRLMANLRASKTLRPVRDPIHGGFALIKPLPNKESKIQTVPLAQINSTQLTSLWAASRPKATVRHFGNSNTAQIQHSLIEQIINHYDAQWFDTVFNQRESLSMMDYGCTIIRPFYDNKLNQIFHLQPVIENKRKTLFESYAFCASCGYEGAAEEFERSKVQEFKYCPKCESSNVPSFLPKQEIDVAEVIGAKAIKQGDIGVELLDVPAANWDLRVFVQESPYFHYVSEVSTRLVESILGIEVDAEDPDNDFGLQVLSAIGLRGGSVEGYGRDVLYGHTNLSFSTTLMREEHYLPEMYAGTRFSEDEKTVSGEVIPKNVPLEKVFPDGLLAVGFNNMDVLVGAYNDKRREVSSVFHIQSHSGVGKGTSDAIDMSRQLNMAHTASLETIKRFGAGGGIGYDRDVLTQAEAKEILKPGALVGVKMKGTNYTNVNQAIWQMNHVEANQSNMALVAQLTNLINISFQTTEFTNGVADKRVKVDTARGQELLAAQNQQRSIAPLSMKGWSRAQVFEQIIELFRENIQIPMFFGTGDKFALTKGRFISGKDLPDKIKCDFVPNSENPSNSFTQRQNFIEMAESSKFLGVSGFAELAQINPRIASWWAHKFGVDDLPLFNQQEILIVCQERLDNLKELAQNADLLNEISGFYPNPEETTAEVIENLRRPVLKNEENHVLKAQVLAEYLDDDDVQNWSGTMIASVNALIELHYEMDEQQKLRPQLLAQKSQFELFARQQQFQNAMTAPAAAQTAEQELYAAGMERAAGLIEKEDDFAREQESADLQFARDMELEKMRQSARQQTTRK